jgi:LAO/AO transport system kinase
MGRVEIPARELARLATGIEQGSAEAIGRLAAMPEGKGIIVGVTGPPGAGKSSLVDALTADLRQRQRTVAILAVDPSSHNSGGAILGDRIRMQRHYDDPGVFIRSMATRGVTGGLAAATRNVARLFCGAGFDYVVIETVGVGQDEIDIAKAADAVVLVLTPVMGDDIQAIKAGFMEIGDIFVINKADYPGAEKTRLEIETMLSYGHTTIPIIETVATTGIGVPALANFLESCKRRPTVHEATDGAWAIDHLGIAVSSLEEALRFYETGLGMPAAARETVEHEQVRVAMLPVGDSRIELLEPTEDSSTVGRFLARRGPGLHHVALRVPDLAATIEKLEKNGARLIGKPQQGAGGHLYVFVHPESAGGVLWEIIQG